MGIAAVWFDQGRWAQHAALTENLDRRVTKGRLRKVCDTASAARLLLETVAFWAVHRALGDNSWRFGVLAGLFVWLQFLSSVYYGMFLAMALLVLVPALLLDAQLRRAARGIAGVALGGLLAAALTFPYTIPYMENARTLGDRPLSEVATYSARPISYLASPTQNWLWSWTSDRGGPELVLFPGIVVVVLAVAALLHRPEVLFLDEPTSGVDPVSRDAFWRLIGEVAAEGTAVLVTTHYMREAENCDRVAFLNAGRLLTLDAPAALRRRQGGAPLEDVFVALMAGGV